MNELERIAEKARKKFGLLSIDIVHRIGQLKVGNNILVIVVGAGHRKEAFHGPLLS
jgi:molybdopterin synthase catalytic subunit